jgi:hypothetical protein
MGLRLPRSEIAFAARSNLRTLPLHQARFHCRWRLSLQLSTESPRRLISYEITLSHHLVVSWNANARRRSLGLPASARGGISTTDHSLLLRISKATIPASKPIIYGVGSNQHRRKPRLVQSRLWPKWEFHVWQAALHLSRNGSSRHVTLREIIANLCVPRQALVKAAHTC